MALELLEKLDRPALTTDVIVGFPGETDGDFAETLRMVRDAGFARVHAFPFSAVRGTAAWEFRQEAPPAATVKRRMAELRKLADQTARGYRRQLIGEELEGLVEATDAGNGRRIAMTGRYQTVRFPAPNGEDLTGHVLRLAVEGVTDHGLRGRAAPPAAGG
jgi:threonylcarbamoyladenosine tRNA methylthiotransferase MtaB